MKRSTKTAPVTLSTSYLIGSPCIGISMITLQSSGTSLPEGTRSRFMSRCFEIQPYVSPAIIKPGKGLAAPFLLGFVPRGQCLQIGHPGEPGLRVRRDRFRRHDDVEQRRAIAQSTIDRCGKIFCALDTLGVHAEGARHGRVVGKGESRSNDFAVRVLLV